MHIMRFFITSCLLLSGCFGAKSNGNEAGNGDDTPTVPTPTLQSATVGVTNAVLSDSNLLTLNSAQTEIALKGATTSAESCQVTASTSFTGSLAVSSDGSGSIPTKLSSSLSLTAGTYLDHATLSLGKSGSPTGHLVLEVRDDNAGEPGALLATSEEFPISSLTNTFNSTVRYTFSFSPRFEVPSSATYHFVLTGASDYVAVGSDGSKVMWGNGQDYCGWNDSLKYDGSAWSAALGSNNTFFYEVFSSRVTDTGTTADYAYDTGSSGTVHLSTFQPNENSLGEEGSISYDVGASDDSTPTYSLTNLTAAQVRAAADLSGRYFFLRVRFLSDGGPGARFGQFTVDYTN